MLTIKDVIPRFFNKWVYSYNTKIWPLIPPLPGPGCSHFHIQCTSAPKFGLPCFNPLLSLAHVALIFIECISATRLISPALSPPLPSPGCTHFHRVYFSPKIYLHCFIPSTPWSLLPLFSTVYFQPTRFISPASSPPLPGPGCTHFHRVYFSPKIDLPCFIPFTPRQRLHLFSYTVYFIPKV